MRLLNATTVFAMIYFVRTHPTHELPCATRCEAQFKSDFRINFNIDYDRQFFHVPLDSLVVSSVSNLTTFCVLLEQRGDCNKRECGSICELKSSEHELCEKKLIRDNIPCLRETNPHVQLGCSRLCRSAFYPPSDEHLTLLEQEQHRDCVFTYCHKMCQQAVISHLCPTRYITSSRESVESYYNAYLMEDAAYIEEEGDDEFPSFCRKVTPGFDEDAPRSVRIANARIVQSLHERLRTFIETI